MAQIFPIDFEEKLTIANGDFILFSDSEDGNKIKKAQYSNLKGEKGDTGTPGTPGQDGEDGAAATITVGSTTTGTPGSSASVTNSGTSSAAVLDFTIPQGAKGEPGEDGQDGADGAAATITVGTTTTLPAGSSATVTNVGTSQDAILNFGIPKGDSGSGSGDVSGPASSTDGDVAIFDGNTGKLIKDGNKKISDFATSTQGGKADTAVQPGDLSTVATTGSYTDLLDKPTIPTVNDGTLTITQNGTSKGTFTANQSSAATIALTDTTYTAGTGLALNGTEFSNSGVTSFNGSTGAISYTAPVTSVNGSTGAVSVTEFNPGGTATTGYVVTKTADGYEWAAAAGGDVQVSSQANNILTSGMKIRAGTQANYEGLGSYDSNTLYLTI